MEREAIIFEAPGVVRVKSERLPACPADMLLVATLRSAISTGTELLLYRGEMPASMMVDETLRSLDIGGYPLKYGYAVVGRVITAGPNLPTDWQGRLVFSYQPHQSHFFARPDELYPLPAGMDPETAVFLPNMETAVAFVMDGRPVIGERVGVWGQGIVGLLTTQLLSRFPLTTLVTFDRFAARRQLSLNFGASQSMEPAELQVPELRNHLFESREEDEGFDLAFELSGRPQTLNHVLPLVGYHGRVVIGSWYGEKSAALQLGGRYHRSQIRLFSSQVSRLAPRWQGRWNKRRRLQVAWAMLADANLQGLITHRFPLSAAGVAYNLLDQQPEKAVQVIFTYEENV